MKPKQYAIAIYQQTRTLQNLLTECRPILQVLNIKNIDLIRPLGKKSGKGYDKQAYLRKRNLLKKWKDYEVLQHACAYLELKMTQRVSTFGDHELFIFDVISSKTNSENDVLMFRHLIDKGLIL